MQKSEYSVRITAISFFATFAIVIFYNTSYAAEIIPENLSCIRSIKLDQIETLASNSAWRQEPLNLYLSDILSRDLNDIATCEQTWYFSADEFEEVQEWCLKEEKGSETNKDFLNKFSKNIIFD